MKTATQSLRDSARRWLRWALLPGFALTLLAAMWLAVGVQLNVERQGARAQAAVASQALARIFGEHVSHILHQGDHATQLFKLKFEESGARLRLPEFARRHGLLDSVLPARLQLPLALYDRHGAALDQLHGRAPADVATQPWFRTLASSTSDKAVYSSQRSGGASGALAPQAPAAPAHRWQIQVARRLVDASGQFAGAIVIQIDPLYFVDDHDRLDLGEHDALALISPGASLATGRVGERLFTTNALLRARGDMMERPAFDQTARVYGFRELPRFGLVAVVGVTDQAALAAFTRHQFSYLSVALLASVLILLVVTLLMKQSAQLRASIDKAHEAQALLRAASDGSLDALLIYRACYDADGQLDDFIIADINERGAAMMMRPRAELLGQRAFALVPRMRETGFFERYAEVLASGQPREEEIELRLAGDAPRWIHHQIVPIKDGLAVTSRNITARKQVEMERHAAEKALRESEARLRTIADTIPAGVAYVDARQVYRFHNLPYNREFARDGIDVPGRTIRAVVGEARYGFLQPYIERALRGETLVFEEEADRGNGEYTEEVTYIPQFGEHHDNVVGFHIMRHDITAKEREKRRLLRLALLDPLTGLMNRAGFLDKLDSALQTSVSENQLLALIYLDIDHFKPVNDTHGHDVGDKLLKAFASRLTHALRASDTVARLGGDEFTVIMEGLGRPEDANAAAAKIVATMRAPFVFDGLSVSVSASVGLVCHQGGTPDAAALLKQADMLLYQAKQGGRDTYRAAA